MIRPTFLLLLIAFFASAVAQSREAKLPYDAWYLGFQAPAYMEVWLETADVEDTLGNLFPRAESGTVSLSYAGNPAGWNRQPGWGAGRDVTGATLPRRIYVRWQSLAEPQTYQATIDIPEHARSLMLSKALSTIHPGLYEYQRILAFELAPGGWIKGWVMSPSSSPIAVLCQKGEVVAQGPYGGQSGGKYRPLTERAKPYLATHPVPYGSWDCSSTGEQR